MSQALVLLSSQWQKNWRKPCGQCIVVFWPKRVPFPAYRYISRVVLPTIHRRLGTIRQQLQKTITWKSTSWKSTSSSSRCLGYPRGVSQYLCYKPHQKKKTDTRTPCRQCNVGFQRSTAPRWVDWLVTPTFPVNGSSVCEPGYNDTLVFFFLQKR